MLTHSFSRRLAAGAIALGALSACGGGSDSPGTPTPPPGGGTPPPSANVDQFFVLVAAKLGALLDDQEPAAIDHNTETRPEDTEPQPVPAG